MARGAYISGWGAYLPNAPIENQQIEDVLGHMKSQSAAVKRRVLINNGITRRYYAIDPATGAATHTNARLTAEAIKNCLLYTSDAADEEDSVDLGGRRIIK